MKIVSVARGALLLPAAVIALALNGCGSGDAEGTADPTAGSQPAAATDFVQRDWCVEHGVPESQCGQCDAKLAAEFQQKGDWCEEHNRPESQCFICRPDAEAKFAAVYEAKFGEKPPKPTE
jgi:cobalt-zinc-cadmium efflux system membrane fusion protein